MSATLGKRLYFIAFVFVALALGPALAHLFALPNKIGLDEAQYLTVQQIYAGWALLGVVVFGALLSTLVLAVVLRRDRRSEEHTSELQSLMRSSYAVFCLKKKNQTQTVSHISSS